MTIRLLDRDNMTVRMTEAQIAESIRKMGNPAGKYVLGTEEAKKELADKTMRRLMRQEANKGMWGHATIEGLEEVVDAPVRIMLAQTVLQFRASTMPHYSWLQVMRKKWRWNRKQKAIEKQFKENNQKNLIWKPTPFVLEMPWLRLKGKKAVTINVE